MSHRLAVVCFAAAVGTAMTPAVAAEAPSIVGQSFELAAGDDPVEAFALSGLSVAGASYEFKSADG
ncbi:hypothetical protein J8J40_33865, partial [Mycobacterium tuberculosis]|nr:hypothetical protein [Mycobacterium tuberculosis]